jgi:hypothetical protein
MKTMPDMRNATLDADAGFCGRRIDAPAGAFVAMAAPGRCLR